MLAGVPCGDGPDRSICWNAVSAAIDHVFICCDVGAPEAERLRELGLQEGAGNTHPGQGTACRRFFFENVYLELLWVAEPDETRSALVAPTRLWERWSQRDAGASPFGIVLRPSRDGPAPFPTWPYRPPYLPDDLAIDVAVDAPLEGPAFFFLGFAGAGRGTAPQPRAHGPGFRELSAVEIFGPAVGASSAVRTLESLGLVRFHDGDAHRLELTFDAGRRGSADLRPQLPLTLRW